MNNSIMVLQIYRSMGTWAFDDAAAGIVREPFVSGIPQIIDRLVSEKIGKADKATLFFSAIDFPGQQIVLDWQLSESGGNWYECKAWKMRGWLCPTLFDYFNEAPKKIYARVEATCR